MAHLMEAQDTRSTYSAQGWLDAIDARVSRRKYDGTPISPAVVTALQEVAETFGGDGVRAVIVADAPEAVFTKILGGRLGGYGRVTGVRTCAVLIGRGDADVAAGYLGEAVVLEATRLGVDSCWIGGSFDADVTTSLVRLAPQESVLAVIALGRAKDRPSLEEQSVWMMMGSRRRLPVEKIAEGIDSGWPRWARAAVEAARLAPSGGNQQPWRFALSAEGELVLRVDADAKYPSKMMDCGIAMLHAEVGSRHAGVRGHWERMEAPLIARFVPVGL
jgi:nitroreductase